MLKEDQLRMIVKETGNEWYCEGDSDNTSHKLLQLFGWVCLNSYSTNIWSYLIVQTDCSAFLVTFWLYATVSMAVVT